MSMNSSGDVRGSTTRARIGRRRLAYVKSASADDRRDLKDGEEERRVGQVRPERSRMPVIELVPEYRPRAGRTERVHEQLDMPRTPNRRHWRAAPNPPTTRPRPSPTRVVSTAGACSVPYTTTYGESSGSGDVTPASRSTRRASVIAPGSARSCRRARATRVICRGAASSRVPAWNAGQRRPRPAGPVASTSPPVRGTCEVLARPARTAPSDGLASTSIVRSGA